MNYRITKKERGLLKGAIRRVFSRSELRQSILAKVSIEHTDVNRPRVRRWGYCESCGEVTAQYELTVDHISPVIPTDTSFEEMGLDKTVDNMWCSVDNLQALCDHCHDAKTALERKQRKRNIKK